ncbi:uncharacterized protein LODBEIA_P53940 [Lodderomyces beijingensis]|uniref:Peroxidase n=1 Tax=Lodderomyces beijingensis TaxID=1775926 RepID=A0ABP0ZSR2_9ASCO
MSQTFKLVQMQITSLISVLLVPFAFIQSFYSEFPGQNVWDRAYYLTDRYIVHTPKHISQRLRAEKVRYVHNGFQFQQYQGYNSYLKFKRDCVSKRSLYHKRTFTKSTKDKKYIERVKEAVKEVFPADHDDGSLAPVILRLAWHACATYNVETKLGGSNGATMRYIPELTDEGNMGLEVARAALEPVKAEFPEVTYSDLWTLAGKVAIEHMGGPEIEWIPGRYDCMDLKYMPPAGLLPFADKDANHVRTTFTRMGMTDQETVALIGAHGLGRCHKHISGWDGHWTQDPLRFSNEFYKALVSENWHQGTVPETGRRQYYNDDESLMMLNTDMELLRDPSYKFFVMEYAKNEARFFQDFAEAFAKLLELGIRRDTKGDVVLRSTYM